MPVAEITAGIRSNRAAYDLTKAYHSSLRENLSKWGSASSNGASAETDVGEADLETTINDLMSGQYSDPVRMVAFNTAEHWSEDASEDVAREILRRLDLAGQELPSSIQAFVGSHPGPDRQLTLRLA
jgi:hypothetical protein